ncbi:mercury(II) reductase [Acidithiobacillus caldus]|jgi:mercuric reductase|uniref:mercury(II) reductase n=1 Tax=Acidithiobacillus caldus TaxID=33059 RepID=UPI0007D91579|nr:mercury(II) reductase [Acidithiobacillus caldus]AUW32969.1 mercury(II) reductase [Acidithiobacillus caldus]QER45971.1 Mercuric reductase (Hg(II) reductase) dbj [Acidithiobacillus caldus]
MSQNLDLGITGMTCEHCARTVEKALRAVPGVLAAEVSWPERRARIQASADLDPAALGRAVTAAGYGIGDGDYHGGSLHVAIIGSGSAAFAAALRLVEGGARVTMIEAGTLGGTCVNVGCVPSKIFIRAAQTAHILQAHPVAGLEHHRSRVDRRAMQAQQQARVEALRQAKYQRVLEVHPQITLRRGRARFLDRQHLEIADGSGRKDVVSADRVLIATGSRPAIPPIRGLDQTPYWTSTEALAATEIPRRLLVIGASIVALELAQAFARLGSSVTILARSTLLSQLDSEIGKALKTILEGEGLDIRLHSQPDSVHYRDGQFHTRLGEADLISDALLVATGRRANTDDLGLEALGVACNAQGAIAVDSAMRSTVAGIFAAGDCSTLPQYVYVAAAAGTRAAVNMLGGDAQLDLAVLPAVVFTDPQVATVGLDEKAARAAGHRVTVRRLNLDQVPRALANFDTRGFIKMVADADTDRLLGVQVLAAEGGELIQTAAVALRAGWRIEDLASMLFPYLTMVEGLKLCAQTFTKDVSELSCCAG